MCRAGEMERARGAPLPVHVGEAEHNTNILIDPLSTARYVRFAMNLMTFPTAASTPRPSSGAADHRPASATISTAARGRGLPGAERSPTPQRPLSGANHRASQEPLMPTIVIARHGGCPGRQPPGAAGSVRARGGNWMSSAGGVWPGGRRSRPEGPNPTRRSGLRWPSDQTVTVEWRGFTPNR